MKIKICLMASFVVLISSLRNVKSNCRISDLTEMLHAERISVSQMY